MVAGDSWVERGVMGPSGGELGRWATPASTMRARNSSGSMLRLPLFMVSTKDAAEYCTAPDRAQGSGA